MGQRDVYGPMIEELLDRAQAKGMTSREIIESIQSLSRPVAPGRQTDHMDTGWGIRAALNRLYRRGLITKVFEFEKDASGKPVERPPRREVNQFGEERLVRVGPMRQYKFFARQFTPWGDPNVQWEDLPEAEVQRGSVKVLSKERIAELQAEGKLPNEVQSRGKR